MIEIKGGVFIFVLCIRTVIIYAVLILSMRLSGKRQVGELQLSELITAFLISEVASTPLSDLQIPIVYAVIPILILICLEITVSFITTKSSVAKKIFEPSPTVLISDGTLRIGELEKQRLTADELISALRLKDISDIADVRFCFLEHNGQLSAFKNDDPLTLPIVVDGNIHRNHLSLLGLDENWLKKELKAQRTDLQTVFLALSDGQSLNIYAKKEGK